MAFGTAFDHAWFDPAGAIADFVAGNLKETVFAQRLPDRFIRRHQPLRQERVAANRKAPGSSIGLFEAGARCRYSR